MKRVVEDHAVSTVRHVAWCAFLSKVALARQTGLEIWPSFSLPPWSVGCQGKFDAAHGSSEEPNLVFVSHCATCISVSFSLA